MESKTATNFNPEDLLASYEKQGYIINRGVLTNDGEPVYVIEENKKPVILYYPKRKWFYFNDKGEGYPELRWPVDKKAPKVETKENLWMDFREVKRLKELKEAWPRLKEKESVWGWKEEEVDKIKNPELEQLRLEADKQIIWGRRKIDENRAEALRCFEAQGWKQYDIDMPEGALNLTKGNFMMSYFLKTKEFSIFIKDPSSVTLNRMGPELYRLMGVLNPLYAMKEIEAVLSLVPHEYHSNKTGAWVYYQSNGFDRYFIEKQ